MSTDHKQPTKGGYHSIRTEGIMTREELKDNCCKWLSQHKYGIANGFLFLSGGILLTFGGLGEAQVMKISQAGRDSLFTIGALCIVASIVLAFWIYKNPPQKDGVIDTEKQSLNTGSPNYESMNQQ